MKIKSVAFYRIVHNGGARHYGGPDVPSYADMLRYDIAFESLDEPGLIAFPTFITSTGRLGGSPTHGRWKIFHVELCPATLDYTADLTKADQSRWITYRHPRDAEGRPSYGELVAVPISRFTDLAAKDTREL